MPRPLWYVWSVLKPVRGLDQVLQRRKAAPVTELHELGTVPAPTGATGGLNSREHYGRLLIPHLTLGETLPQLIELPWLKHATVNIEVSQTTRARNGDNGAYIYALAIAYR